MEETELSISKRKLALEKAKKQFKDKTNTYFFIKSQTKLENSKDSLDRVTVPIVGS